MPKVSIELQLQLDKLRQDLQRARGMIQSEMSKGFGGGSGGGLATDPSNIIAQMLGTSRPQRSHMLMPNWFLNQAQRSAASMGNLRTGSSFVLQSDKFLAQGASNLLKMGPFSSGVNWRQAALGAGAGLFSPWIGASMLNKSGIFGGGGGGGGMMGKLLGGSAGGFGAAYLALQFSTRALKGAFDELRDSVKGAARLYTDAIRLRTTPGQLKGTETVMKALGISNPEEILQQLSFGRGQHNTRSFAALAGAQGQEGTISYIQNLTKSDSAFWNEFAINSKNFRVVWTGFQYELEKMAGSLANDLIPALTEVISDFNKLAGIMSGPNSWGERLDKWVISFFPDTPGKPHENAAKKIKDSMGDSLNASGSALGRYNLPPMGAWERMGYIIGTGTDYQKKAVDLLGVIAHNTAKLATINKAPVPSSVSGTHANPP